MDFYHVKDDYIRFLRAYDAKVAVNKSELRPYVGVVLYVKGIQYYAPFTSPKAKHRNMHNTIDFRKIKGGLYGAINFNNMIPVPSEALMCIDISKVSEYQYRRLLQNQYNAISEDFVGIKKTAERLRNLILTDDDLLSSYEKQIKKRCCDLRLLESVYTRYGK